MKYREETFDRGFWKSFGWFLMVAFLICCLPWLLAKHSLIDFSETGQIGDTIGGIMGPFIAIAAAGLTFIAFWVQYKANIYQRDDIALERFESNLFEMIHIQQEITNSLVLEYKDSDHEIIKRGREVFPFFYEELKDRYAYCGGSEVTTFKRVLAKDENYKKNLVAVRQLWFLDHYIRHLYRIFKYIDEAEAISIMKKQDYAAIVRATLSTYELVLLYYIGFSHSTFKKLIEKYALLNNHRPILLAETEKHKVAEKFKEDYTFEMDENIDTSEEYKKSAFVQRYGLDESDLLTR